MQRFVGIVEKGSGRGKVDFVPTINLLLSDIPGSAKYGIYAAKIYINDKEYNGAAHYGPRSSVDNLVTFEVNIFDFDQNVYGEEVAVELLDRIRDIVHFDNEEELMIQIQKDIEKAKEILKS